jgi:hypothetical protein
MARRGKGTTIMLGGGLALTVMVTPYVEVRFGGCWGGGGTISEV